MIVPFEHGNCPHCGVSLDGEGIWDTGLQRAWDGSHLHYGQKGIPAKDKDAAYALADKYAECYGADRTKGRWGRAIGIYDMERDRTVKWKCPDCEEEWGR